jgi:hypothetical protein
MNTIFIQIASYRDPELLPTIRDCISNAEFPENLKFCIGWQRSETESLEEYYNDPRFIILSIPHKDTKGCCWMRNKIQQFYNGEKYTLQLDSHHRFIKGWDTILIEMLTNLQQNGIAKPIITAYLPSYNPVSDPEERVHSPWKIHFNKMTEDGQILCIPSPIHNYKELTEPLRADFYSAHFAFTLGFFCIEVPHDPTLYFTGEEMNITLRAFTYGYDLFHPHIVIAWHEYTRKNRQKHWDDDKEWWKKDSISKQHYKKFIEQLKLSVSADTKYGIGKERTIEEYGSYHLLELEYCSKNSKVDDVITIKEIEKTPEVNQIKELKKDKVMDDPWRHWINENIELGVDRKTIRDILIKSHFSLEDIATELEKYK